MDKNSYANDVLGDQYNPNKKSNNVAENIYLVKNKGTQISLLPNDTVGLMQSLKIEKDLVGNPVSETPSLGAIEPLRK